VENCKTNQNPRNYFLLSYPHKPSRDFVREIFKGQKDTAKGIERQIREEGIGRKRRELSLINLCRDNLIVT
jgi:hypothetical protein